MPQATAAFKDSAAPMRGIVMSLHERLNRSSCIPFDSFPIRMIPSLMSPSSWTGVPDNAAAYILAELFSSIKEIPGANPGISNSASVVCCLPSSTKKAVERKLWR